MLGRPQTHTIEGCLLPGFSLPTPVRTPLGGRVRAIACFVDINYRLNGDELKILRVRLGRSQLGTAAINVMATRRGEAWVVKHKLCA